MTRSFGVVLRSLSLALALVAITGCQADLKDDVFGGDYADCTDGDLDACYRHGQAREVGTSNSRRSALVTYQYACLLDHGPSCGRLAHFFGAENISPGRALENLRKGCDAGEVDACMELAERMPERAAIKLWRRTCEDGAPRACEEEATILRKRFRLGDNLVRAQELSTRACEEGHAPACISAGQALLFGSGVDQDTSAGLDLLERSCTENEGHGCVVLARVWQDGLGVDADQQKADRFYAMAEEHVSEPVADDTNSAFLVYVNACNYGDLLGCFNAAWFLAEGAEVRRNISTSRELFERSCEGGVAHACERWDAIQPRQKFRVRGGR